jgi:hypothetical protein
VGEEDLVMRTLVAAGLFVLLAGCGEDEPEVASDCSLAIRLDGTVYVEAGFVRQSAQPAGQADESDCADNGEDARGAYFPDDARQVDVWSFDGQDSHNMLAVREPDGKLRVFVAEGQDSAQILRALKGSEKNQEK